MIHGRLRIKVQIGLSLGTVYYFLEDYAKAKKYLTSYLQNNHNVEGGWTNLGWIYIEEHLADSAELAFEQALTYVNLQNKTKYAECLNNLGYAKGLNGKFDKGISLIRKSRQGS